MATCTVNMFPEDPFFCWEVFDAELAKLLKEGRGDDMIAALTTIAADGQKRDDLVHFVSLSLVLPVALTLALLF
jgi:hypothetical protein